MLKTRDKIAFIFIFGLLLFLALNRHSKNRTFTYHSELWADKAGYQVFLPALFYYHFNTDEFPDDISWRVGTGFRLDTVNNKVLSKYPIGVAVLQLPFFSAGALVDRIQGNDKDLGYTVVQHKMIDVSTAFYTVLGLLFLFMAYSERFGRKHLYILLFLLVFGSNLFFYVTRDAGLSHAYSFFVFSVFLYQLLALVKEKASAKRVVFALFFASLGCLIRPINVVFFAISACVVLIPNYKQLWSERSNVLKGIVIGLPLALILPAIQLLYYKYAYGDYLAYSYNDESFIYALKPRLARVWFAPANGLLPYSPVILLFITGILLMWKDQRLRAVLFALLFLSISYLYAAWWTPGLGCGYGHRGFIEHLPFLSFPMLVTLEKIKARWLQLTLGFIGLAYIGFLVNFQYHYDGCWYGNGYWDWNEILIILGINN